MKFKGSYLIKFLNELWHDENIANVEIQWYGVDMLHYWAENIITMSMYKIYIISQQETTSWDKKKQYIL